MKKFILIDGNAIIHRAFHATPPFRTTKGELVNAVYGFGSMLLTILNSEKPDYIAVSFDLPGKTFRHEQYEEYKATRKKAPDGLYEQIPRIKEMVRIFDIPIYEAEGFEADDVLGTLAKQADNKGDLHTYIVTGDRDTFQLISDRTRIITPTNGFKISEVYDAARVQEKYGVTPDQIRDLKGLQGDSSDNIKGVEGVGPKTATTLLQEYQNLEGIYENIEKITGKLKDRLQNGRESAFFSRDLATIVLDVPVELDLNACITHEYDRAKVLNFFQELEFKSLVRRLTQFNSHSEQMVSEDQDLQPSLFD